MSENNGILLKINAEKNKLLINNKWFFVESKIEIRDDMIGNWVHFCLNEENEISKMKMANVKLKEMKGKIQSMNLNIPRISMHIQGRLMHFYLSEKHYQSLKDLIKPGEYVQFYYYEDEIKMDNISYYVIAEFKEDKLKKKKVSKLIKGDLFHTLETIMDTDYFAFLDLEFSMSGPEYRGKKFSPEIIQVGIIIANAHGEIVEKFSSYIKPTVFPYITDKTQEFLKINKMVIENGMSYKQFYDYMTHIKAKYQPLFMVWGVSDGFILTDSCTLNHVPPLFEENQLIDLQRVHRQYYEIGQDIGLYNAMKSYGFFAGIQIHDALVDALILQNIFYQFKTIVESDTKFPFKQNYQHILENKQAMQGGMV